MLLKTHLRSHRTCIRRRHEYAHPAGNCSRHRRCPVPAGVGDFTIRVSYERRSCRISDIGIAPGTNSKRSFKTKAEESVRKQCVFTTHTPVPAGHDRFPVDLMEFTLHPFADWMKLTIAELMAYGQTPVDKEKNEFTMTILGLKLSRAANGVSEKHGEVSRQMWTDLYPGVKVNKIPIGYITNGIHIPSWTSPTTWEFWERHNSHRWKEHFNDPKFWQHIANPDVVSDEQLWALRYELRRALIDFVRRRAGINRHSAGRAGKRHWFIFFRTMHSPSAMRDGLHPINAPL